MSGPSADLVVLRRLQIAGWLAVFVVSAVALGHAMLCSERAPFLLRAGGPPWIVAPMPLTTDLIVVDPAAPPVHTFVAQFDVASDAGPARLSGRALRRADVELNGRRIEAARSDASWREGLEADVSQALRRGRNEVRVAVRNPSGPPALQLRIEAGGVGLVETGEGWRVEDAAGTAVAAVPASDRARHPDARALPGPLRLIAVWWAPLLALFVLSCAAAALAPRWLTPAVRARMPEITLGATLVFWLLHYLVKLSSLPLLVGFDVPAHLIYVDHLRSEHALPLADHGFSTYHPPLFYLLTAGVTALFDVAREGPGAALAHRLVPFLAGVSSVVLTWLVARRLWPGEALRPSLAVAFAGLLPMHVYVSAYVSNEGLHAAWVSGAVALAASILLGARAPARRYAALAVVLGLALLTKFTSLLVAPLVAAFAALRVAWLDGRGALRGIATAAAVLAGAATLAGWFYLRNWLVFGDPLVWNLDVPGANSWWMQPGFHTPAWYLHFGESLAHPFFAGFSSFWDGVYSTLWGDGLAGGMKRLATRHRGWSYDFMTIGYALALPASLLVALGFVRLLAESLRGADAGRRLVLSLAGLLVFALGFSLLYITLSLAFYAQAKAFYALAAILPLSLVAAQGLAWPLQHDACADAAWLRVLYWGWLGTLGSVIVATYLG